MQPGPPGTAYAPGVRRLPPVLGWLLLLPAFVALIVDAVWPVARIASAIDGWRLVTSDPFTRSIGRQLTFALVPLLVVLLAAPAAAWVVARAGTWPRRLVRLALALPLAAVAPTSLALIWMYEHEPAQTERFTVVPAQWDSAVVFWSTMTVVVFAVALTCFLAAWGRRPDRTARGTVVVVGVVLAIATIGLALQQYTFTRLVDWAPGNRAERHASPGQFSEGGLREHTAAGIFVVVLVLAVLGTAIGLLVIRTGLRIESEPAARHGDGPAVERDAGRPALVLAGAGVVLVGTLALIVIQLGPWLTALFGSSDGAPEEYTSLAAFGVTWLQPLQTALVSVSVAALAAFAIVVVRPLGARSVWLLLVFAPWLLVGAWVTVLPRIDQEKEILTQAALAAAPPSWVSVPALFLFAMVFRGLRDARLLRTIVAALPMFALAVGALWLVRAQDLLVPTLIDHGSGRHANSLLAWREPVIRADEAAPPVSVTYPVWLLMLFTLGAAVLHLFYLDRIRLTRGERAEVTPD